MLCVGALAVALAAAASLWRHSAAATGVVAGGAWSLMNLWCLGRALSAWFCEAPSQWRVAWWVVVKFPVLYGLAVGLLMLPGVSRPGFGLGFSIGLLAALAVSMVQLHRTLRSSVAHGR